MVYNILFAGVGGLGATLTSVIVARAAHFDGYRVGGAQLHGLAQRGGSIPIQVRFGKEEIHSPVIPQGEADLIFGLELIEGLRYPHFASPERTNFVINTYAVKPVMLKPEYPSQEWIKKKVKPLAKKAIMVDAGKICKEKFGNIVLGNIMLLGIALNEKMLPMSKKSIIKALKVTAPREVEKNLAALELGLKYMK